VVVTADRGWHDQFRGQVRMDQDELLRLNHYLTQLYLRMLPNL
jgi:hypothetical protein